MTQTAMLGRHTLAIAVFVTLISSSVLACSCSNDVPIQRNLKAYRDRAVFTVRVMRLTGQIDNWTGKRESDVVLARVQKRYWGLPWYWPRTVVLDGQYPCDIGMSEGEEYLVSGRRIRYGVLKVNLCSRTRPLKEARVDLRTLDGSHCAAPGGTIVGRVAYGSDSEQTGLPFREGELGFQGADGQTHTAQTDQEGIYELPHLPAGPYALNSRLSSDRWAESDEAVHLREGACVESTIYINNYILTGRVTPALRQHQYATASVVPVDQESPGTKRSRIQPDGRFYVPPVPPGEYFLVLDVEVAGGKMTRIYYPGTTERNRAMRIQIPRQVKDQSFDFDFHPFSVSSVQ